MMKLKADIEAEITMFPAGSNPRKSPISDNIIGYYGCPIVLPSVNWDCRMVFPDSGGQIDFGQTARALIQFLNPQEALKGVREGDCFNLWENGVIASGVVKNLMTSLIVSQEELILLNNALNEILNGPGAIEEWEFQTRTGATVIEAKALLARINQEIDDRK